MTKIYEVWTCYKGETGVSLFRGTKRECERFKMDSILEGVKPNHLVILYCGYKP